MLADFLLISNFAGKNEVVCVRDAQACVVEPLDVAYADVSKFPDGVRVSHCL